MIKGGVFITGTDTEVGKTWVSCAMLSALKTAGYPAFGVKPVAAGAQQIQGEWRNEDALALQQYSDPGIAYELVNPCLLHAAVAPHIAAEWEHTPISLAGLEGHCRSLLSERDGFALVEGAGGWRVPLNDQELLSDLAIALGLPVVMVVPIRLGCLNHALLTAEAIRRDGLRLGGWVANLVRSDYRPSDALLASLMQRLEAPCLGTLFCLESTVGVTPTEAEAAILAAQLDVPRLLRAFGPMKKQS